MLHSKLLFTDFLTDLFQLTAIETKIGGKNQVKELISFMIHQTPLIIFFSFASYSKSNVTVLKSCNYPKSNTSFYSEFVFN